MFKKWVEMFASLVSSDSDRSRWFELFTYGSNMTALSPKLKPGHNCNFRKKSAVKVTVRVWGIILMIIICPIIYYLLSLPHIISDKDDRRNPRVNCPPFPFLLVLLQSGSLCVPPCVCVRMTLPVFVFMQSLCFSTNLFKQTLFGKNSPSTLCSHIFCRPVHSSSCKSVSDHEILWYNAG